jgi:hypothetical protein
LSRKAVDSDHFERILNSGSGAEKNQIIDLQDNKLKIILIYDSSD